MSFTAIYDACVLYPAPLRDFLMWLALTDLFRARWTEEIHAEWMRNVLNNRSDLTKEQLTRTKNLMNANVRDCLVTDYESLIETLVLPDLGDRHVLAAAIRSQASVIVTFNLKDFPFQALQPYGVKVVHPDEFVQNLIDINLEAVCTAATRQRQTLKNPPKTIDEYLETLLKSGLKQTVVKLRCPKGAAFGIALSRNLKNQSANSGICCQCLEYARSHPPRHEQPCFLALSAVLPTTCLNDGQANKVPQLKL